MMARLAPATGNWASSPHARLRIESVGGHSPSEITLDTNDLSISCVTEARRIFGDHIEHGLNVRRRASDDAQDLTRRGLLLQRFLELLKKPHVLDGDDRLIGEGFHQLHLPFSKRFDNIAPDSEAADIRFFPQQRYREHGARTHLAR